MSTYTSSSPIATEAELTGTSTATTGTAAVINSNQQIPSARHLRLLDVLQHATYCSASNNTCEYNPSCQQMKQLLHHASTCLNGGSNCIICKDVHRLLTEHAQECEEQSCQVFKCQDLRKEFSTIKSMHDRLFSSYHALFPSTETTTTVCAANLSPVPNQNTLMGRSGRSSSLASSALHLKLPVYNGDESNQSFPPQGVSLMHGNFYESDSCSSRCDSPRRDTIVDLPFHDKSSADNGSLIFLPVRATTKTPRSVIEEKDIIAQNKLKKKNAKKALKKLAAAATIGGGNSKSATLSLPPTSERMVKHSLLPPSSSPSPLQNHRTLQRVRSFSEFSDSSNDGTSSYCPSPAGPSDNVIDAFDRPRFKLARSYSTCSEASVSEASCGASSACPSTISCYEEDSEGGDIPVEIVDLSLLDLKIAVAPINYENTFTIGHDQIVPHYNYSASIPAPYNVNDAYDPNVTSRAIQYGEVPLNYSHNEASHAIIHDFSVPSSDRLDTTDTDRLFTLFDEDDEIFQYLDHEEVVNSANAKNESISS